MPAQGRRPLKKHMIFERSTAFDAELAVGVGKMALDGVYGKIQMLGDLAIVPVAGGEHADGKLGGAEIVGDIVTGVWIVHAAPAPGKTIGDVDDALEIFGPLWLDDDFEHTAEKAVVLAEGFDEIVRLSLLPGCEQMRFSAGRVFQAHGIHDGDEMEIDGGDGIDGALKIQRIFHHSDAAGVIASEVFLMRLHIHGELAQARRQIFEGGGKIRQGVWQGQVEQNAGGGHNENGSGRKLWHSGESHLALLHARQGGAGAAGRVRYSDDGEPQKTAGLPTLEVLQHAGLTDVVCVVTRYFGGILLGAGGLTRAYSKSARDALVAAGVSEMGLWAMADIPCPYALFERVRGEVTALGGTVDSADYGADIRLTVSLPAENTAALRERLTELSAGGIVLTVTAEAYRPGPKVEI